MTTCLTTSTSQGITTSLHTRAQPRLRVDRPWATALTPRVSTTQPLRILASTRPPSTPTNRTSTPLPPLSPTRSPSQPPTPPPPLPLGPGSAYRSRRRSPSPTLRRGGRQSRPTPLLLLVSTCLGPRPRTRRVHRAGTLHTPTRRFRSCTPREATRATTLELEGELTRFLCLREG